MWRLPLSKLIICWDFSKSQQHLMQFSKEAAHQVLKLMYKKSRVRIELKFWWKFSQIIIIFWGQFLPPAVYLSALFEVILTWRWSCWIMALFNKKATSCLHMYVIIKGSNHQCWTLIMSIEKWDSNHFSLKKFLDIKDLIKILKIALVTGHMTIAL